MHVRTRKSGKSIHVTIGPIANHGVAGRNAETKIKEHYPCDHIHKG